MSNITEMNKDYWHRKEFNKQLAIRHTIDMENQFHNQIIASCQNSIIYDDTNVNSNNIRTTPIENKVVVVEPMDSIEFLISAKYMYKTDLIALLNFASYKNPGGKFLEGSMAQEECLCHSSYLYNVLKSFKSSYYSYNRANPNNHLYTNRAIYTPMIFLHHGARVISNVITCAAPNKGAAQKYNGISDEENHKALYSRCKFILDIAKLNYVEVLILGAFGCGVFKQNPYEVATIFKELLNSGEYQFKIVGFPIPNSGHSEENYKAFKSVFYI